MLLYLVHHKVTGVYIHDSVSILSDYVTLVGLIWYLLLKEKLVDLIHLHVKLYPDLERDLVIIFYMKAYLCFPELLKRVWQQIFTTDAILFKQANS